MNVCKNKRKLASTKVWMDEDPSLEVGGIRKQMVSFLKDAKNCSNKAFLTTDVCLLKTRTMKPAEVDSATCSLLGITSVTCNNTCYLYELSFEC
jgi:hypothetical protein